MANPSAAHEPSMEEILASIRQIISEDGEGSQASESTSAQGDEAMDAAPEAAAETALAKEAITEPDEETEADELQVSLDEPIATETFEAEAYDPEPQFTPDPEPAHTFAHGETMTSQSSARAVEAEPYETFAAPTPSQAASRQAGGNLLSSESDQAVHGAFSALAHTILAQNARTLEDLVAEMLQPMLKNWLDDNLPALVERLVQDEIQRVSRGRP